MFSFKNFIENLQSKPEQTRIRILWASVVFCMFIVMSIWFLSFKGFTNKSQANNSNLLEPKKKFFQLPEKFKKEAEGIPSWDELEEILKQAPLNK